MREAMVRIPFTKGEAGERCNKSKKSSMACSCILPAYRHCDRDGGRVCPAPLPIAEHGETGTEVRKSDWSTLDILEQCGYGSTTTR